jgi:uncharacterized membrane protein
MLPTAKKLTLSLLATITLKVVTFHVYAPFSVLLPFFKCILEISFCEGAQHYLRLCLDHLSCVKMVAFQFYLQLRKQKSRRDQVRSVGWVGTTVMLFLVKKSVKVKESCQHLIS